MSSTFVGRIPLFNGENYSTWRPQMEGILHKLRLLKYVDGSEKRPEQDENEKMEIWEEKDKDAKGELLLSLEPAQVNLVKNFKTSHEIWKYLDDTYNRKSVRQKAEEFRKLINIKMDSAQSMDAYIRSFSNIVTTLEELDAKLDENLLVIILLDSLPDDYKEVRAAFDAAEEYPSLQTIKTRLLEVSDRKKDTLQSGAAYKARGFQHKGYNKPAKESKRQNSSYFPFACRVCGKRGHKGRDCKYRKEERSNYTDKEEKGFILEESLTILEKTDSVQQNEKLWYLDSGATSHMCCWEDSFETLLKGNYGHVQLANHEKVEIQGMGTVKLCIKIDNKSDNIRLFNTLYFPDLRSSLISTSKATDKGYSVTFTGDKAVIRNSNEKLLVANKIGGLYRVLESRNNEKNVPN